MRNRIWYLSNLLANGIKMHLWRSNRLEYIVLYYLKHFSIESNCATAKPSYSFYSEALNKHRKISRRSWRESYADLIAYICVDGNISDEHKLVSLNKQKIRIGT